VGHVKKRTLQRKDCRCGAQNSGLRDGLRQQGNALRAIHVSREQRSRGGGDTGKLVVAPGEDAPRREDLKRFRSTQRVESGNAVRFKRRCVITSPPKAHSTPTRFNPTTSQDYAHKVIDHAEKYVDGKIHTNGLENFWSLLKRGINGTYVSVEPYHLFRYLDEQSFRYNNRKQLHDSSSASASLGKN
jgi:hypothetical protein